MDLIINNKTCGQCLTYINKKIKQSIEQLYNFQ